MEPVSHWWTTGLHEPEPPLDGDTSTDVAIIGGGFTGLSTAYHLKELEPSAEVLVLEQDEVGYGPSGCNGGFGMTLFGMSIHVARLRFGKQRVKEAHHWPIEPFRFGAVDHARCRLNREAAKAAKKNPSRALRLRGSKHQLPWEGQQHKEESR